MNNDMFKDPEENTSEEKQILTYVENEDGFQANLLIKQDLLSRVKKTDLKIKKENIFKNVPSKLSILNPLKRKNEIFYFISTEEMSVDIKDTIGSVYLPLLTKEQINKKALGEALRPRISMDSLYIGESSERKDDNLLRNMSLKIDSLRQNIKQITEIINE